jgi:glycosyltransferase involved in cell wall biosynthesis
VLSFSVVTPSLNQGRFLAETLRSVVSQAYPCLEYVVVDGGSTDRSLEILASHDGSVRWTSEPDAGQAHAVNKGIRSTTGAVIGWLNSDDVYRPGALEAVASYFAANPAVDVVYGDADVIDASSVVNGRYPTAPWDPAQLKQRCFLAQPAVFFRRRVVDRYGALDKRLHFCMDYEYWLRLAAGGARFAYLPRVLAATRLHPDTKTLGSRLQVHTEIDRVLRSTTGRVPDGWLVNHAHTWLELHGVTSAATPLRFGLSSAALYMALSLRWNGLPSAGLVRLAARRILGGLVYQLRPRSRFSV